MLLSACSLPELGQRTQSSALDVELARQTSLGLALEPSLQNHGGLSGIRTLSDPLEAFAARVLLTRVAEQTIDVQYYIWRNDKTGSLLLHALLQAAERGVRVRVLLDDNGISGMDARLRALSEHPLIEVRLFNPFVWRHPKFVGFLTDFSRLNRRMHNKSFVVDNRVAIVGGRNIGDEYFGATQDVIFADLDIMTIGRAVTDTSADFDRYWASQSAYPIELLVKPSKSNELAVFEQQVQAIVNSGAAQQYEETVRETGLVQQLLLQDLNFIWAPTQMVSDDPNKVLGLATAESMLVWQLDQVLGEPQQSVDLVSSYFVPTAGGVQTLLRMNQRPGMQINVLTNSLAATDVVAVHAGYAKRRKALLRAGVRLWELRPTGDQPTKHGRGPLGSSGSALHAKTFAIDGKRVFVGSFNFDPRSAHLNTELGFIIENSELAQGIAQSFDDAIPYLAYEVLLDEQGELYWLERQREPFRTIRHKYEPAASLWRRVGADFISLLPVEWLL